MNSPRIVRLQTPRNFSSNLAMQKSQSRSVARRRWHTPDALECKDAYAKTNEEKYFLSVGRHQDRWGICTEVWSTQTRAFVQWMKKTSFSLLLDWVNFKIPLKNPTFSYNISIECKRFSAVTVGNIVPLKVLKVTLWYQKFVQFKNVIFHVCVDTPCSSSNNIWSPFQSKYCSLLGRILASVIANASSRKGAR